MGEFKVKRFFCHCVSAGVVFPKEQNRKNKIQNIELLSKMNTYSLLENPISRCLSTTTRI